MSSARDAKKKIVNGVECGIDVEELKAEDLLMAVGRDQFIVQRGKHSFSGMVFNEARLVGVEE